MRRLVAPVMARLMRARDRLPRWFVRIIDDVAVNPDGPAGRLSAALLGGTRAVPATQARPGWPRVYIGPTNYAGQGYRWARALEHEQPGLVAANMAIELPGGFAFPADSVVPVAVQTASKRWQRAEFDAVSSFSHVLFEAERSLFGSLYRRDVLAEIDALQAVGVSCALLSHGTDVRDPRAHLARERFSPYTGDPRQQILQAQADRNLAIIAAAGVPVFVSTPDLLIDVPSASWCPVVVDVDAWAAPVPPLRRPVPVVVHVPSMGFVKGTQLIEPALQALHDAGVIEFRSLSGIPAARMPDVIADADVVLDQFRIGSYGVGAVEAMAAGRVVVGHVSDQVRLLVEQATGLALPVVEADPETIADVIVDVATHPEQFMAVAGAGVRFADEVHAGRRSARVLLDGWITSGA